jgi:hypothetical protein
MKLNIDRFMFLLLGYSLLLIVKAEVFKFNSYKIKDPNFEKILNFVFLNEENCDYFHDEMDFGIMIQMRNSKYNIWISPSEYLFKNHSKILKGILRYKDKKIYISGKFENTPFIEKLQLSEEIVFDKMPLDLKTGNPIPPIFEDDSKSHYLFLYSQGKYFLKEYHSNCFDE